MEDREIVELYWQRSESAIAETESKYGTYCRYIARNILLDREDSEECVNDAYLGVWNSIPTKRPQVLKSYIGRITRNIALNRFSRLSAAKRNFGQVPLALDELEDCVPARDGSDRLVDDLSLAELLNHFLSTLPVGQRKIFVCRYWYLSPVKEIAADLDISESNVKMSLLRSRDKLKLLLEKEGISL